MKALCVAACVALMCLPVSATTAQKHNKTHHKVTPSSSAAHRTTTAVKHTAATSSRPEAKTHAGLQNAKYSTATTSTTTSTTSSTSKSTTKHASSKKKSSKSKHVKREPTQMAPSSDRISEIQTALGRGGYYTTDNPSGKWDADTVGAVQKFQSANGLDATGKLDALTLQKLGLGSDVAGVSAPKGIVPHSCCSITPSPSYAPPASAAPKAAPSAHTPTSSASVLPPVESSQK
jgi:peptidoglycan hydrolase-like protein with peptidoglycan-binding domain